MTTPGTDPLVQALLRPEAWRLADGAVEHVETHISHVFLAESRVYKIKKAIVLPFLDYGTLERRRAFCLEELRLNRRLAPDVYLRVAPIARTDGGALLLDGEGEVVEWAVEMRRLPANGMLDRKLERGEIDDALVAELARTLAAFHAAAATGPGVDEHGRFEAVARNARGNLHELADHAGRGVDVITPRLHAHAERCVERFLAANEALLGRRVVGGRIRDGHGDLHAGNVCVEDSRIVAYDCIEFSERFRCADVACDLAFLAMDLDRHGFRGFASVLVRTYAELAADRELEELLPFYKLDRALVRAKVTALRALGRTGEERDRVRREAQRYAHVAASYTLPACLVLTSGLPASGKSTVAGALAGALGAALLQSDVRRKRLAHAPEGRHAQDAYGEGLYSPELKQRTYESLLASAREDLLLGRSVVVDATFPSPAERAPFRSLARELARPFAIVEVEADEELIRRRLDARASDPHAISDAGWEVYVRAKAAYERPTEIAPGEQVLHRSGETSAEQAVGAVIDALVGPIEAR